MKFRILSLDGGGLKGHLTIGVLKELNRLLDTDIVDQFDLIAGTSTGGLLACGLSLSKTRSSHIVSTEYEIDKIQSMYNQMGPSIFPSGPYAINRLLRNCKSLLRPKYNSKHLQSSVRSFFKTARLSDCGVPIVIPAYDVLGERPLIYSSRFINRSSNDFNLNKNYLLSDICLATSAAPTYLTSVRLKQYWDSNNQAKYVECIDGGVFLNNPALYAILEVISNSTDPLYVSRLGVDKIRFEDISVLSIGTGDSIQVGNTKKNWGKIRWAFHIAGTMMQSSSQITDAQISSLLEERYFRIDIPLSKKYSGMDDSREKTKKAWESALDKHFVSDKPKKSQLIDFISDSK